MRKASRLSQVALFAGCTLLGPIHDVSANDVRAEARLAALSEANLHRQPQGERSRDRDNGPRNVPTPRGASLERAQRLGLGTHLVAKHLLRAAPKQEWMDAVHGSSPENLLWPVEGGRYGRGFGFTRRKLPNLRHNGIDIGAPTGAEVRAVADGIVAYSDNTIPGMGNCVIIVHKDGLVSLYAHNSRVTVQPGWRVTRGERIALVGMTGLARGPHLHFEMRRNGKLFNPIRLMRGRNAAQGDRS